MRTEHAPLAKTLLTGRLCLLALVLAGLQLQPCTAAAADDEALLGAWAFSLPDGNPVWLKLSRDDAKLTGSLLWSVGSARPIDSPRVEDGVLTFTRKISWRPFGEDATKVVVGPLRGTIQGTQLRLHFMQADAAKPAEEAAILSLAGVRIPPPPPRPDLTRVRFGETVQLFNGKDLDGWKLSNPKKQNGWSVRDGCLVNATPKKDFGAYGSYGNLVTTQSFNDFQLTIEYNVPAGGNSGIYLRGMYEAQVVDRDSRMQGIQGPGAVFGRIASTKNAAHAGGAWNTYVLTLVDRHITVVLNGQTVIDNVLLEGCTGGGLQANDTLPGPLLLQGDHTSVQYRNIRLRPVGARPTPVTP